MIIDLHWLKNGEPKYHRTGLRYEEAEEHLLLKADKEFEEVNLKLFTSPKGFEVLVDDVIVPKGQELKALHDFNTNVLLKKYKHIVYL